MLYWDDLISKIHNLKSNIDRTTLWISWHKLANASSRTKTESLLSTSILSVISVFLFNIHININNKFKFLCSIDFILNTNISGYYPDILVWGGSRYDIAIYFLQLLIGLEIRFISIYVIIVSEY